MIGGSGGRARGEAFCHGIVRRMVSLPRNILGGFSRAVDQGIDLMRSGGGRRNQHLLPNFPLQHPPAQPLMVQEEWTFLESFEQHYGTTHPFFYACQLMEALKMAQDEHKFLFMYLHSPEHPFTPFFCRETLCSEIVIQFLDVNFVSWGALANRGEGFQMATVLQPASFPFCAVVAPASGDNLEVLQQIEGPVSPAELVEILQRMMEEQGLAFGSGSGAKEEEKRRADRRLREEQDAAYFAALQIDNEKDKLRSSTSESRVQKQVSKNTRDEKLKENLLQQQHVRVREVPSSRETQHRDIASREKDKDVQILIRFPNGERKEESFLCTDKVQAIYRYIDSLGLHGVGNYRLVSSFPRKVYGVDQMGMTLKDCGLHPKASLFLEPI